MACLRLMTLGVGKTSLIRSIVQKCEDIVHVDPLASGAPTTNNLADRRSSQRGSTSSSTQYVSEVYASTRPYPPWWSDAESTTVLRQRKSLGGTVLERNICFVDTPGYSSGLTRIEVMDRTLQYTGEQVKRSLSNLPGEGDIVGLLSGNGGSQVDLVLYLISLGMQLPSRDLSPRLINTARAQARGRLVLKASRHAHKCYCTHVEVGCSLV